jgi:hypothetical protein
VVQRGPPLVRCVAGSLEADCQCEKTDEVEEPGGDQSWLQHRILQRSHVAHESDRSREQRRVDETDERVAAGIVLGVSLIDAVAFMIVVALRPHRGSGVQRIVQGQLLRSADLVAVDDAAELLERIEIVGRRLDRVISLDAREGL